MDATDASGIHRVIALYQAGGDWQSLDLGAAAGAFTGSLTVPSAIANEQIRVVVEVVDGAGNVSWASNKGPGFVPTPPPPPGPTIMLAPVVPSSGWFTSAPQISVSGAGAATFTVSIDRGPEVAYVAPFVPSGLADGSHLVEVTSSDGGSSVVTLSIDGTPPQVSANLSPPANAAGWNNTAVTATFSCTDGGSGVASCPPPASTGTNEGAALTLSGTSTDRAGLPPPPHERSRSTAPRRRLPPSLLIRPRTRSINRRASRRPPPTFSPV